MARLGTKLSEEALPSYVVHKKLSERHVQPLRCDENVGGTAGVLVLPGRVIFCVLGSKC